MSTTQNIVVSGIGPTDAQAHVLMTFDSNQIGVELPWPNTGNQLKVPGFMYLMGNCVARKDGQGNIIVENPNANGSLAV
jgi:hypothetical protein